MPRPLRNRRAETLPDDLKEHYEEMFGEKFPLSLNEAWEYVRNKFNELGIHSLNIMSYDGKVRVEHHWRRQFLPQMQSIQYTYATTGMGSALGGAIGANPAGQTFGPAPPQYQEMMDYWSTNKLSTKELDRFIAKIIKQLGDQNASR